MAAKGCPFDLAQGKRAERVALAIAKIGCRGWGEMLRCAQHDRRGKKVKRGRQVAGRGRELGTGWWRVEEADPHRSEDRPLHAERTRRPWEVTKCAVLGPIVGLGRDGEPETHRSEDRPLHGEPDPGAVRVRGRAGSGRRGCR